MLQMIYCQPIWRIILEAVIGYSLWTVLGRYVRQRRLWQLINAVFAAAAVLAVAYTTILSRSVEMGGVELRPFQSFVAAKRQPEIYRTMLMNVFLFLPLGLTLGNALPENWRVWRRILLTVLAGLVLSCAVEWVQYRCALGWVETDDVLCNTLGAFLGGLSLLFYKKRQQACAG